MSPMLLDCLLTNQQPPAAATVTGDRPDHHRPGCGSGMELGQVVGQVGDLVTGLPRLLMAISAELALWQNTGGFGSGEVVSCPPAAVGMARLALAEATTAAQVLARCVSDTVQVVATLTAADTDAGSVTDSNPTRSKVSA